MWQRGICAGAPGDPAPWPCGPVPHSASPPTGVNVARRERQHPMVMDPGRLGPCHGPPRGRTTHGHDVGGACFAKRRCLCDILARARWPDRQQPCHCPARSSRASTAASALHAPTPAPPSPSAIAIQLGAQLWRRGVRWRWYVGGSYEPSAHSSASAPCTLYPVLTRLPLAHMHTYIRAYAYASAHSSASGGAIWCSPCAEAFLPSRVPPTARRRRVPPPPVASCALEGRPDPACGPASCWIEWLPLVTEEDVLVADELREQTRPPPPPPLSSPTSPALVPAPELRSATAERGAPAATGRARAPTPA